MTSTTQQQMASPKDESVLFEPDLNDELFSEFVDFGPEDSPFFENLAKKRTKTYPEQDITCRHCSTRTKDTRRVEVSRF